MSKFSQVARVTGVEPTGSYLLWGTIYITLSPVHTVHTMQAHLWVPPWAQDLVSTVWTGSQPPSAPSPGTFCVVHSLCNPECQPSTWPGTGMLSRICRAIPRPHPLTGAACGTEEPLSVIGKTQNASAEFLTGCLFYLLKAIHRRSGV